LRHNILLNLVEHGETNERIQQRRLKKLPEFIPFQMGLQIPCGVNSLGAKI
jgi:hypothetical protein